MIESPYSLYTQTLNEAFLRRELEKLASSMDGYDEGMGWDPRKDIKKFGQSVSGAVSGAVRGVTNFVERSVSGLDRAMKGITKSAFNGVKEFGETLALTARAATGDVEWSRVSRNAGKIVREVANVQVLMNPARFWAEVAQESKLTRQAFKDLDRYTGGMLTTSINITDIVQRSVRGDAITKEELIKDGLFGLQVLAAIGTGGSGAVIVGSIIGTLVGQQVCQKQTKHKNECMAAFQLIGTLLGSWGSGIEQAITKMSVNQATKDAVKLCSKQGWVGNKECEILGNLASAYATTKDSRAWEDFLLEEGQKQGLRIALNKASDEFIKNCQKSGWGASKECDALGNMLAKYMTMPEPKKSWEAFVTEEAAAFGVENLISSLIPKPSGEFEPSFDVVYSEIPGQTIVVEQRTSPALFLALATGAALLLGAV